MGFTIVDEYLICNSCSKSFKAEKVGGRHSNGAIKRKYLGKNIPYIFVKNTRCYPCMRKIENDYNPKKRIIIKKYEKTKTGFLVRVYRNMKSRVTGVQKNKHHLYKGKYLLPKEEFYEWSKSSEDFHWLFHIWENSNYERRLTPSIDRIDSNFGYQLNNMRWVPFHENCRNIKR